MTTSILKNTSKTCGVVRIFNGQIYFCHSCVNQLFMPLSKTTQSILYYTNERAVLPPIMQATD